MLFTFCLSSISLRIFEFRSHTIHESLHVQCLYFPLVVQFSMTDFLLRSLRRSTIISQPFWFVKRFFESFLKSFFKPLCHSPSSARLAHYTTSSSVCQYLFSNFFEFFQKKIFQRNFQKPIDKLSRMCYNMQADGPLVKRLRHRPLTAKTWVRFPYGSPKVPNPNYFVNRNWFGFVFFYLKQANEVGFCNLPRFCLKTKLEFVAKMGTGSEANKMTGGCPCR